MRRRAAVPRCRRCRSTPTTTARRCSCSSSGPARWRPASSPTRDELALHRRDRPPPRRAAAGDRAGRRPPAHPRRRRGRRRARPPLRACCRPGYRTSTRHGSLRRRGVVVVRAARRRPAADVRRPVGVRRAVHRRRRGRGRAASTSRRSPPALAQLVERSLVMRAPDRRYVLLETLRAFGAEQLGGRGPARRRRASATPATTSTWVERADARLLRARASRCSPRSTPRSPSCAPRSAGCSTTARSSSPAGWSRRCCDYGFLRLRPDVLAWAERVTAADPDDRSPLAPRGVGRRRVRGVDGRRRRRDRRRAPRGRCASPSAPAADAPPRWRRSAAAIALFEGRLDDAAALVPAGGRRGRRDDPAQRLIARGIGAARPRLRRRPDAPPSRPTRCSPRSATRATPHAAYAWYCAGEADLGRRRRPGPGAARPGRSSWPSRPARRSSPGSPARRRRRSTPGSATRRSRPPTTGG